MNKRELVRAVSKEANLSLSQEKVAIIFDTLVTIVKRTLDTGEPVKLSGFGSFVMKDIPSKRLYSPSLKKYIVTKGIRKIIFVEPRKRK